MTVEHEAPAFIRAEREHLATLEARLRWLNDPDRDRAATEPRRGGRTEENGFFPGESNALAWALSVLRGDVEPLSLRVERLERQLRQFASRLGRVEHELSEEDE